MSNIHGKTINCVYQTTEYDKFKFIKTNRPVIESHIKNLGRSMKENGWLNGSYIIVNKKNEVIDGQNRLMAAKETKTPVQYIIDPLADENTMHELNKSQLRKGWKLVDWINRFMIENNKHYISLMEFMEKFPMFKPTEAMMFCKNKYVRVPAKQFEDGLFTVSDMKKANSWAEQISSLKPFFKDYNKALFVRALITCLTNNENFTLDEFIKKVKLRPLNMVSCGSVEQYIETIERVYNHYRAEKIILRSL